MRLHCESNFFSRGSAEKL